MTTRHYCDRCEDLVSEAKCSRGSTTMVHGSGLQLSVQLTHGNEGSRLVLCHACAKLFLPLLPDDAREEWARVIARDEAMATKEARA